jgi:XrtJ-associated TM-motif-TM protein
MAHTLQTNPNCEEPGVDSPGDSTLIVLLQQQVRKDFESKIEDIATMKKTLLAVAFALMLSTALPLRAQSGCTDSPEDPTVVLALLAGAGTLVAGIRRSRISKK